MKIIKIVCLILALAVFAFMAIGSGEDDSGKLDKTNDSVAKEADKSLKEDEQDDKNDRSVYNIGDTLNADGLKINYTKAETYISKNEFDKPGKGKRFIRLYFYIKNESGSDKLVNSFNFKCYADGDSCDETVLTGENELSTTTLSDGRSTKGYVYFEIPKRAKKIEVEYETNWFTDEKAVFVYNIK